ncbi:hypothetical protein PI124_g6102 [Phytophthora idaei]|nr:hypothetical protein PI125_g5172 [Phytophthora idaei]KAG3150659.1 hypothetical protein PI126_g11389 [Phytophthora idaei]KAG3249234.1 hypothetical protein PI124_g6102 [Phytophthora idaei]
MELSRVLCWPSGTPPSAQGQDPSKDEAKLSAPKLSVVPDKERKRPYRMSVTQKRQRQEDAANESRVYNLTLDINNLRQQIQQLRELRDAHATRLLLDGQRFEGDVLQLTWTLLDGLRCGTFGLSASARSVFSSRTHISQHDPGASGGVHQFVMQQGRSTFRRPSFSLKSIRVLAMVDCNTAGEQANEIRSVCGRAGGCVVEVLASLTGGIARETIAALFPQILSDEVLVARIIGQRITFSSRLLLFFNKQRRLVQQVAQADLAAALKALHLGESSDFTEM